MSMTVIKTIVNNRGGKKVTPWRMRSEIWMLTYFSLNISNYKLLRLIKLKFRKHFITNYVFRVCEHKTYAYLELNRRLDIVNPLFFDIKGDLDNDEKTGFQVDKLFHPDITVVRNKKECLESVLKDVVDKTDLNVLISQGIYKSIGFSFVTTQDDIK